VNQNILYLLSFQGYQEFPVDLSALSLQQFPFDQVDHHVQPHLVHPGDLVGPVDLQDPQVREDQAHQFPLLDLQDLVNREDLVDLVILVVQGLSEKSITDKAR
jgi:hypothetical protein